MVSVLRTLQAEWNELVPQARALGIPRVRTLNAPLETIEYRRTKLEWLRSMLGTSSMADLSSLTFGVEIEFVFPRGPGGLWKITPDCERALDQYEGVSAGLYLKKYFKVRRSKHVYKCLFYQMRSERGVVPPGQSYLDSIVQGYRDFDLDLDYLDVAIQESWGNKKMTDRLRDRQIRRGETNMVRDMWSSEGASQ